MIHLIKVFYFYLTCSSGEIKDVQPVHCESQAVWPEKNHQMSLKIAQKWFY